MAPSMAAAMVPEVEDAGGRIGAMVDTGKQQVRPFSHDAVEGQLHSVYRGPVGKVFLKTRFLLNQFYPKGYLRSIWVSLARASKSLTP